MSEKIVQLNEEVIKGQLKELVRGSVEETLNGLLENSGKQPHRGGLVISNSGQRFMSFRYIICAFFSSKGR